MKKILSSIALFAISFYYSQCLEAQIVYINSTFSADTTIYPFNGITLSYGLKIAGDVELNSDTSLVRAILITDAGNEFMVYESYTLIAPNTQLNFTGECDETCYLDGFNPAALRIEIINAEITINFLNNSLDVPQNAAVQQHQEKRNCDFEKIEALTTNVADFGFNWTPGDNGVVEWYYAQKKQYWGEKYNLLGYDYYTGGIYEAPGVEYATVTYNWYVDLWDWRNRHGANNPSSPYWDYDDQSYSGWLTSPKDQGTTCGACSAFGTLGSIESTINLYYNNQLLDFDLSEQELISCIGNVTCEDGGHPNSIYPWIYTNGVVDEQCYPYLENNGNCNDVCANPTTEINITGYSEYDNDGTKDWDDVQLKLIEEGPQTWIIPTSTGTHCITMTGYIYDNVNQRLLIIFKESLGDDWGQDGTGFGIMVAPAYYSYVGNAIEPVYNNTPPTDIIRDEDGDGYDNWGIGPKPPGASTFADCDDSNPLLGRYLDDYSCKCNVSYDPNSTLYITSQVLWDTEYVIDKLISIGNGGELTITSTVFAPAHAKIVVKPGGRLIIDGGRITKACDDLWRGIEVWGNINAPQSPMSNQGYFKVMNGGKIEYAETAILIGATDSNDDYIFEKSGGIIKTENSTFKNNLVGVKFLPYYDSQYITNLSSFEKTEFITYDELNLNLMPEAHIVFDNVYGVRIEGCSFGYESTNTITLPVEDRGTGILAFNSSVQIYPACKFPYTVPCPEYVFCEFNNLRYGIKAFNTGANRLIRVDQAIFSKNIAAIYLSAYNYMDITSNSFYCTLNYKDYNELDDEYYGGIYMDACTGYHIEDNEFYGRYITEGYPNFWMIGMYIKDSGEEDNEIYNNFFHNLDVGIVAEGVNKGDETGLTIKCNDMWDNGNDIFVITNPDAMIPIRNEGIKSMQGADSDQTQDLIGNTFTTWFDGLPPIGEGALWSYKNNLDHFNYYHHEEQDEPRTYPLDDNFTDQTITLHNKGIDFEKDYACPSRIGGGGSAQSRMTAAGSNIITYETQLANLTDGGDTQVTNDSIMYSMPGDGLELRDQLLDESPYLSDTVMQSAIAKENVLPNAMLRDVLVANPHSAKNNAILDAAENRTGMPGYMMNEILGGLDTVSAKELLESKLAYWKHEYRRALNDLARGYFTDTLNTAPFDSLQLLLENQDDLYPKYNLALVHLDKSDTTEAINTISDISADFELNSYQSAVHAIWEDYFEVLEEMHNNGLNASQLDSVAIATLTGIMDMHAPRISTYATGLLVKGGHIDFTERIALPGTQKAGRVYPDDRQIFNDEVEQNLKLLPNPAKNYVVIEYDLSMEEGQGIIIIRDTKGVAVKNMGLHKPVNQITVELDNNIPSGMYILSLYAGNKHIASKQLSVAR